MEAWILEVQDYNLIYTTPYDYIRPFFLLFPWFHSLQQALPDMIDFAISIPQLHGVSA